MFGVVAIYWTDDIDRVWESRPKRGVRMVTVTMGRNAVCSCGSGRKYKKCCLARVEARIPPRPPGREGENLVYVQTPADMAAAKEQAAASPKPDVRLIPPGAAREGTPETIQATSEHPFYVYGKGWTPLREVRQGDWLRTEGGWIEVNAVEDTGRWGMVYNVRVADHHTYFVGKDESGSAVWAHNTCYEVKVSPTGLVQIFVTGQTEPVAKARSTGSLDRAAYYLANLQSDEAGFNRVLDDIRTAIGRSTNATVRAVTIRMAASENRNILVAGTAAWRAAAYAIGHTASGHSNDYRVADISDAQQLVFDAYDATTYGRLPQRRPGMDEWQDGRYQFGYHFDTDYEGDPQANAFQNNLRHIKWKDWRTDGGHTPADGHIYYGTWTGPHQYTQPHQGW